MVKVHFLREGSGESRVASSFEISFDRLKGLYEYASVHFTAGLPTINSDQGRANSFAPPKIAVIEFSPGEPSLGDYSSPGFNALYQVDPIEVYKNLVEQKGA
jgi:hypothetical protein